VEFSVEKHSLQKILLPENFRRQSSPELHFTPFLKTSLYGLSEKSLYTIPENFTLRTLSRDFQ
jgi:hypothetical protein